MCRRHAAPTQAQSASTEQLDVPTCRRSTIGGRAFPVAGAKVWNGLPSDVTSTSSLSVFKNRLKTQLFYRCYETVWLWITFLFPSDYLPSRTVVLAIVFHCLGHSKKCLWWWRWWWWQTERQTGQTDRRTHGHQTNVFCYDAASVIITIIFIF